MPILLYIYLFSYFFEGIQSALSSVDHVKCDLSSSYLLLVRFSVCFELLASDYKYYISRTFESICIIHKHQLATVIAQMAKQNKIKRKRRDSHEHEKRRKKWRPLIRINLAPHGQEIFEWGHIAIIIFYVNV